MQNIQLRWFFFICNELGGNMARSTQFPIMITWSTIIYEIVSPDAAGSSNIHLIWFQIYDPSGPNPHGRVWGSFPVPVRDFTPRSHSPRQAGLPKPDSDPAPDSLGIGLSPNSSQKYTVLYLELIRSLLDPFQVSHTIIETSDSFRLPLTHSELPWLGLSPGMLHKVHGPVPWTNPFTIRSFSGVPHYYWDVGLL